MIELLNLKPGDLIQTQIAYIFGKCIDRTDTIEVTSSTTTHWKVKNCFFKAFVRLNNGKNTIQLKSENATLEFVLYFVANTAVEPSKQHHVRVLYIVCDDDSGNFQSPETETNNCESALKRISLNTRLLQTFFAEILYKKFGFRKTFSFYNDVDNVCELYKTELCLEKALSMSQKEIFIFLANEIVSRKEVYTPNCKYLAILSFTRYVAPTTLAAARTSLDDFYVNTKGFCALGAEFLAVYGTCSLYTWPESIEDIERCCEDDRLVDERRFLNDSAFRNTYWACYSTSLGSLLHEFSHILDLGHNKSGIMARGFDDLFAFFTVNFDSCLCYEKYKKNLTNNKMIERVIVKENDVKEGSKVVRKELVLAMFKNCIEKTFEVMLTLTWNKAKLDYITCAKLGSGDGCNCLMNAFYEECNLNILFNHKWLNSYTISSSQPFTINFEEDGTKAIINSTNGLLVYELRDNCATTVDYEYFSISANTLKIDFKKYIKLLNTLEVFLLDSLGNVQKFKLF